VPSVVRRVAEVLAGADLSTWFVRAQHHGPVRALAEAGGLADLAAELASGRRIAGIALSHLRRWPARPVTATRDGNALRLDGLRLPADAVVSVRRREDWARADRRGTVNVNPAAREGLFLLVQAQTAEARRTTLQTWQGSRSGHLPAG
jgi:hypothetical protein